LTEVEVSTVNVTESVENDELYVDIEVDPSDRGRVIGKNGRLIRSMRVVVRAAAGRDGSTANVELLEDEEEDAQGAPAEGTSSESAEQTQGDAAGQDGAQA
jgi:predicted RNA-binding protein YlqC (UPF0109 family)